MAKGKKQEKENLMLEIKEKIYTFTIISEILETSSFDTYSVSLHRP